MAMAMGTGMGKRRMQSSAGGLIIKQRNTSEKCHLTTYTYTTTPYQYSTVLGLVTAHDTQARVLPLLLPPSAPLSDPPAAPDVVPLLVNYLPTAGDKGGASVLFRLAQGRVPLVRVSSSGSSSSSSGGGGEGASSAPATLKSYVDPAKAGSARLQRVKAAWRRTMLGLSGRAGEAFHRAWREARAGSAAASSLVCTVPGCGHCVSEEDGGLAALRAHVAAAHSAGVIGGL